MRYSPEHKAAARRRIIRAAATHFRRDGIDSVGVVPLMNAAGLTHGGFYHHFASKEALVDAVLVEGVNETLEQMAEAGRTGGLPAALDLYLSPLHRDNPEAGCPAAALGVELARHPAKLRRSYTRLISRGIDLIAQLLPRPDRGVAQAIYSVAVGSLVLARGVSDRKLSDGFLASGRAAALKLADGLAQRPGA